MLASKEDMVTKESESVAFSLLTLTRIFLLATQASL